MAPSFFTNQTTLNKIRHNLNIKVPVHNTSFSQETFYYITVKFCLINFLDMLKKREIKKK